MDELRLLCKDVRTYLEHNFAEEHSFLASPVEVQALKGKSKTFTTRSPGLLQNTTSHGLAQEKERPGPQKGAVDGQSHFATASIVSPSVVSGPSSEPDERVVKNTPSPLQPLKKEKPLYTLDEMRAVVEKVIPSFPLRSEVLDDAKAKRRASFWKEELKEISILILNFEEQEKPRLFLNNLSTALTALLTPAKVIEATRFEREKKWDELLSLPSLRLILAPSFSTWKQTTLSSFYKELPAEAKYFLKRCPVLFLHPLSAYFKNPLLKKQLWNTLVSHLSC